jgi:hypothetical protein
VYQAHYPFARMHYLYCGRVAKLALALIYTQVDRIPLALRFAQSFFLHRQ